MCAIVGLLGNDDISYEVIDGLTTLQHRGQDAAGIVSFDGKFNVQKGLGLINQVFKRSQIKDLKGSLGLGHLRYATQGNNEILNAQPFVINYPYGLAMAHNGNVTNYSSLRKSLYDEFHCLLETSSDLELILYSFACELIKSDLKNITVDEIFRSVDATQRKIKGAYTTLGIIANHGLLAFADPYGIRPLVMGAREDKDGIRYAFASESSCFDYLCYHTIQDIHPGEAIFIDMNHKIHKKTCHQKGCAFCIFEYIYFAREDSVLHGRLVASERLKMGRLLAKSVVQAGLKPDLVIDVPVSAYFFAAGLAEELKVPYRRGLAKNNHVGRSFISPSQKARETIVRQKLNPITEVISGKKVAVVDDSIVRGTTSRYIVNLLKERGAKEVYFISASPPIKYPCVYGIDMSIKRELIAGNNSIEQVEEELGADKLIYQSIEDIKNLYKGFECCYACFNGKYPTEISDQTLDFIENDRLHEKV